MIGNLDTKIPLEESLKARQPNLPWLHAALLLGTGIFVFHPLSVTWASNANYSFGWWIPLVAIFLFIERWPVRPPRESNAVKFRLAPLLLPWGLLFLALRFAAESDPDWRPGLWVMVGLYIAALLGWLWIYGGFAWTRYFIFPVCFLFLSLPWPFSLENLLVFGLMRWNALLVAISLQILGIPGEASGNIIHLPNCELGVEEACSGILSLQASLMLGCLLGEIYHLTILRRCFLVLFTMFLALVGNYGRTFFLALLADFYGTPTVEAWHDMAGYSILIFTGIGSWLASLYLQPGTTMSAPTPGPRVPDNDVPQRTRPALFLAIGLILITTVAEAATQAWYGWRESNLTHQPEWTAKFPDTGSFKPITVSETTQGILGCDSYKAGSWEDAHGWKWTTFWFRYNPKPSNRIVLGWHTPDNCLPSIGLTKDQDYPNFTASSNGLQFLVQPRKFSARDSSKVYLFWVIYPTSGELPPVIDNQSHAPVASKFQTHLHEVWQGYRGVGVETLEMAVQGAPSYETAQAAYLDQLKTLAVPNSPPH